MSNPNRNQAQAERIREKMRALDAELQTLEAPEPTDTRPIIRDINGNYPDTRWTRK